MNSCTSGQNVSGDFQWRSPHQMWKSIKYAERVQERERERARERKEKRRREKERSFRHQKLFSQAKSNICHTNWWVPPTIFGLQQDCLENEQCGKLISHLKFLQENLVWRQLRFSYKQLTRSDSVSQALTWPQLTFCNHETFLKWIPIRYIYIYIYIYIYKQCQVYALPQM